MRYFRNHLILILVFSGQFFSSGAFAQKLLFARQLYAEKSKVDIAGLLPRSDRALLQIRSELPVFAGKKKFTPASGTDLIGLRLDESGELVEERTDCTGISEAQNSQTKKTLERNGNSYLAYSKSSAVILPQSTDWSLAYLDGNQKRLWDVSLNPSICLNAVIHLSNGNCLLGGFIKKARKGLDLWIGMMDNHGKMLWEVEKGGKSNEEVLSLAEDREGRIFASGYCSPDSVFLGNSDDLSGRDVDGFIIFLDKDGKEKFFYRQRGKGACRTEQILALENGYLAFASTFSGSEWRLQPFGFPRKGVQDVVIGLIDPQSGLEKENPLRIFPNPARETVYFNITRGGLKGKYEACLQTRGGEILQQIPVRAEPGLSYRFNVSNTLPGPYFIVLKSGKKEIKERLQIE